MRISRKSYNPTLLDGENLRETGDFEDLHHTLIHMNDLHGALLVHGLLRSEQNPESSPMIP